MKYIHVRCGGEAVLDGWDGNGDKVHACQKCGFTGMVLESDMITDPAEEPTYFTHAGEDIAVVDLTYARAK